MFPAGPAVSEFQQCIRGNCDVLHDHISKMMNDLNLERCRNIPKNTPGADWRCLEELVKADPEKTLFKVCWGCQLWLIQQPSACHHSHSLRCSSRQSQGTPQALPGLRTL